MQQSEQLVVVGALENNLIALVRNLNGNHVVQACLHHLSSDTNKFIFENVTSNCVHVATHRCDASCECRVYDDNLHAARHGCCVMQRCIDYGNSEQRVRKLSKYYCQDHATPIIKSPLAAFHCVRRLQKKVI